MHVEKELWGDTFRRPPRLTPLEARAIRLALEFVGPMIAAEAHTPLDRVRMKLEETFGQFERDHEPEEQGETEEERLVRTLSEAIDQHRLVEFEYLKPGETTASTRTVEPYAFRRELPDWYVDVWDRDRDGVRSFRLDRMRDARKLKDRFQPRPGIVTSSFEDARTARVLFSKAVARWRLERGTARALTGGAAVEDLRFGDLGLAGERDPPPPRRGRRRRARRGAGGARRARARRSRRSSAAPLRARSAASR